MNRFLSFSLVNFVVDGHYLHLPVRGINGQIAGLVDVLTLSYNVFLLFIKRFMLFWIDFGTIIGTTKCKT